MDAWLSWAEGMVLLSLYDRRWCAGNPARSVTIANRPLRRHHDINWR
jgi:hypothetical protein